MELQRIIAYVLLVTGLALIVIPLWHSFAIFTGSAQPPQVFSMQQAPTPNENVSAFDIQKQMENALINILPMGLLFGTLNLASWCILMWILMFGGKQIADIGIKLLRHSSREE